VDPARRPIALIAASSRAAAALRAILDEWFLIHEVATPQSVLPEALHLMPDVIVASAEGQGEDFSALAHGVRGDPVLHRTPLILVAWTGDVRACLDGLAAGADDFVVAPFVPEELVTRIHRRLGRLAVHASDRSADAAFVERVLDEIDTHLHDSGYRIGDLARALGVSEAKLKRRLRALLDRCPRELVRERRLMRAARLLEDGACTAKEAGFLVGFSSAEHFSRTFRQHFGVPPSLLTSRHPTAAPDLATAHGTTPVAVPG
jgi:AraC-like DNA-binding protein